MLVRALADDGRIRAFMDALGRVSHDDVRVYFTGGATAVLHGWRGSTIDVDVRLVPEDDRLYRELPRLKESLRINIELASPSDFIPEVPGWQDRSLFIERRGHVDFPERHLTCQPYQEDEAQQRDAQSARLLHAAVTAASCGRWAAKPSQRSKINASSIFRAP